MEEISNFKFIWEEWIVPLVRYIYNQTDEKFREYCNFNIRKLEELCKNSERYYQYKREELKSAFYCNNYKKNSETEHYMDFHKLSAIIMYQLEEHNKSLLITEKSQVLLC
ncbi:MAG: hypothetical protein IJA34_15270 [Lachnospiraceae bacterium]|nr:hypothetical protein [Lachnospiraceae bacterium]